MFVCSHYKAGVCLEFHCKDLTFGIREKEKVPNSNHACFILYRSPGHVSRPVCGW